ncbi:MAG: phosphoglucosamine mutase, partial [Sulfuricurvum sp.]
GLVSALQILALLITSEKQASKVLRPFELYPQQLVNIKVKIKKPLEQIDGLEEELKKIDALHIRHLIRYSGTENKLRLLLEGKDAKVMEKEMEHLVKFLEKALNA